MIVLDSDVLLIDAMHPGDPRLTRNRAFLDAIRANNVARAVMIHALFEVVGKLSFGTPTAGIAGLFSDVPARYGLSVLPAASSVPEYAGCTVADVEDRVTRKAALGDAVLMVQIELFAPTADALITWNAKHFRGKLAVPVLTPDEWLNTLTPPAGPTP